MSNRHWSFIPLSFFVLLTGPGWSAVDPKTTPQIKATLLQVKSVTLNPTSITGGGTVNGVVTISAAPAQGVIVKIVSSAPQTVEVPQSVVIQPSATLATFIAQTHPVVVNPNVAAPPPLVQISAQIGNLPPTVATLTVLPPTLTALTLNPVSVGGGANATGTVTISGPAPSGGLVITLASPTSSTSSQRALTGIARIPSGISMPSQVTIPAAATSGSFTITTRPVSAPTTFHVDASLGVFVTKTAILTVTAPDVANVKLCRGQLPSSTPCTGEYTDQLYSGGMPWTGTVNLTAPAPAEGLTIALKTYRASGGTTGTFAQCGEVPSVPSTVTVPGGAASANFTVTTYPGYGEYWVEASSTTKSANTLSVDSPSFRPVVPSTAKGGTAVQGKIQLTSPAMAANCGNRYSLASSNTNFAQVPAYVDLTPGTSEGSFPITTSALPASSAPVTVTISVTGTYVTGGAANAGKATVTVNLTITP